MFFATAMSPNPTALRSLVKPEDVEKHRSVLCAEYDDCLDAALRRSWRSWSCGRCNLFLFEKEQRVLGTVPEGLLRPLA